MEKRRVVITGMGVVAPNGIGIDAFWDSLVHGRSAIKRITRFDASSYPCKIAAEISDFDPTDYMDPKTVKRLDRYTQYSLASASMAINNSKLNIRDLDPFRIGVFTATAIGGGETSEKQHLIFIEKGLKRMSPFTLRGISTHTSAAVISEVFNIKGPNTTITSGCNSGLDAIYLAYNIIKLGDADIMIVGAGEAPITPYIMAVFSLRGILCTNNNGEPEEAVKPYDVDASGIVLGEGGGAVILEELNHALKRGANIYGEIIGYSSLNEAYVFGTKTNPEIMAKAFQLAFKKANIRAQDVSYINSHGNAIVEYDLGETEAIKIAFGEWAYHIPISSIKPVTGQSLSVTGVYQMISSLLVLKNGVIPPTINLKNPAPGCDLNYVPNHSIKRNVSIVLMNAHGFGGIHTVVIVRKFNGDIY
jgi:3-oxoacyl-[acyl-carrier-protein] synthase II